jgi:hypothetical protein
MRGNIAAAQKAYVMCQLRLNHRGNANPMEKKFMYKLFGLD